MVALFDPGSKTFFSKPRASPMSLTRHVPSATHRSFPQSHYTMRRHVVFTLGRSGSNFVCHFINAHPRAVNYGEVLGDWTIPYKLHKRIGFGGQSVSSYLTYLYGSRASFYMAQFYSAWSRVKRGKPINFKLLAQIETIGIKEFSLNFKKRNLSNFLIENSDILVINLYRTNQLKRFLSVKMLEATGIVAVQTSGASALSRQKKVHVDLERLMQTLAIYESEIEEHHRMVERISQGRVLHICYEDLFSSQAATGHYLQNISAFLGIDGLGTVSLHQKILPEDLSASIENYEEVSEFLSGTRFETYLDR